MRKGVVVLSFILGAFPFLYFWVGVILIPLIEGSMADPDELCELREAGEGLLPHGEGLSCDPEWFKFFLMFAVTGIVYIGFSLLVYVIIQAVLFIVMAARR